MPLTTAPNIIEQSDFSVGWCPDLERSNIPPNGLIGAQNVLPDKITGAIETRKGYRRLNDADGSLAPLLSGYAVRAVHSYNRMTASSADQFLIIVASSNVSGAVDNIRVIAYNLKTETAIRLSPATKTWTSVGGRHYGVTVGNVFYGGGETDKMYSAYPRTSTAGLYDPAIAYTEGAAVDKGGVIWVATEKISTAAPYDATVNYKTDDVVTYSTRRFRAKQPTGPGTSAGAKTPPSTDTTNNFWLWDDPQPDNSNWTKEWNDNASTADYNDYVKVAEGNTALPVAGAVNSDKAFNYREKVSFKGKNYSVALGLENYDKWDTGKFYEAGERILHRLGSVDNAQSYYRLFRVKNNKSHTAAAANEPGVGANWTDFWKLVTLDPPVDASGDQTDDWDLVPDAPVSSVAAWFGNRLFVRYDSPGAKGLSRLVFSSQPTFYKDKRSDLTRVEWNPTDWSITGAAGAGWQDFQTSDGDTIKSLYPFGYYLLVFKRESTHVIAGVNPDTWTVRQLAPVGAIAQNAVAEHEGLVYFFGDRGFYVTDGSTVQVVPGWHKVRDTFLNMVAWDEVQGRDNNVVLWSFDGFIWISVPTGKAKEPDRVFVYDPDTESFWPQTISVTDVAINRQKGIDQMFFGFETKTGDAAQATFGWNGVAHRSTSWLNFPGHMLHTNFFTNPSFEPSSPTMVNPSAWVANSGWNRTHGKKTRFTVITAAKRRGYVGAEVSNLRTKEGAAALTGYAAGSIQGAEGIYQTIDTGMAGTKMISAMVRLPRRIKERRFNADDFRFFIGDHKTGQLARASHTFTPVGRGWYKISVTGISGAGGVLNVGLAVKPGLTVQVDQCLMMDDMGQYHDYFDGDGFDGNGTAVIGGGQGLVMHYGTERAEQQVTLDDGELVTYITDDGAEKTETFTDIEWRLHSAWFPFGVLNEERRIRRVWAMIRGRAITAGMRLFRNFRNLPHTTETAAGDAVDDIMERGAAKNDPVVYIEGRTIPDSNALSFYIEGRKAPAAVLGVAAQTEPRRIRFHT